MGLRIPRGASDWKPPPTKRGAGVPADAALLLQAVLAPEALDATGGVDQLLLSGEERMARRTDVHVQFLLRRTRLEGIAAGANRHRLLVHRVNVRSHGWTPEPR